MNVGDEVQGRTAARGPIITGRLVEKTYEAQPRYKMEVDGAIIAVTDVSPFDFGPHCPVRDDFESECG